MYFRNLIPLAAAIPALFILVSSSSLAFLEPQETVGPLTLTIASPSGTIVPGQPLSINIALKNSGRTQLDGAVRLGVIDDWQIVDGGRKTFSVGADGAQSLYFTVVPGPGSYSALYPIHAWAEASNASTNLSAHAVLITSVTSSVAASPSAHPAALKLPRTAASGSTHRRYSKPPSRYEA